MRASRAYIAGLGTTGVLVGSALLLLVVVSALVAFDWSGEGFADDIGSLVVDEPERLPVDGPVQLALNAAPAAAAVAQAPAPGSAAAGRAAVAGPPGPGVRPALPSISTPPEPPDNGPDDGEGGGGPPPDPTGPPAPGGLLPETPLSPQVSRLTDGLGDTTQGLTDGLGYTVGRLNPQLGQTLTDTGRTLSDLVRSLGAPRR